MSWSLSLLAPRETELLDALFLSAGRALHLANAYEDKRQYVLRVGNLITAHQADPVLTLEEVFAAVPADKLLGGTLHSLAAHAMGQTMDMSTLHKAREARNFIAHEGASIGDMWSANSDRIPTRRQTAVRSEGPRARRQHHLAVVLRAGRTARAPAHGLDQVLPRDRRHLGLRQPARAATRRAAGTGLGLPDASSVSSLGCTRYGCVSESCSAGLGALGRSAVQAAVERPAYLIVFDVLRPGAPSGNPSCPPMVR